MSGTSQRQSIDEPLAAGELLVGRFRVVRRIAQGGMGIVYEAYDEKLGRRIALKCARRGHGGHLSPEVRLATEVSHTNICKIYEIHTEERAYGPLDFFTMEFLEGQTLSSRLRDGPLRRQEQETIARQVCAGLAEAHGRQIVHGDLKSANVILTKNPDGTLRAVITDFGLARALWSPGSPGGTPGYMAPELYAGAPSTIASDVYALGALLHELVCRFLPHERVAMLSPTVTQVVVDSPSAEERRTAVTPVSGTQVPRLKSPWDPIIARCLQADPKQRYASIEEVMQALGPSALRRRIVTVAGALTLAAVAAFATYERSTAPAQSASLEIAAVTAAPEIAAQTQTLREAALREIGRLRNSAELAFSVRGSRATHRLSMELTPKSGKLTVRATLYELRSGAAVTEWSADYDPAQLRYAPVALAGVVSSALRLPALTTYATVNAAATPVYQQALALLQDDNKLDQALAAIDSAISLDPDSALPLAARAEVERRRFFVTRVGTWKDKAMASLEQAKLRNPDCAEVHRIAGLLEFDRNRPEQAIAEERRATDFTPPHVDAFRRLGAMYQRNGQTAEALQAYSAAKELSPADVRTYQDLANLYSGQSNFAEASKALERAVELAPDRPNLRTGLASSYQDQGRFPEAEAQLRRVLQEDKSAETLVQLGHVLMYEKRDREAVPLLSQAAEANANIPFAWLYLGLAYRRTERTADARRAFQQGLTVAGQQVIQLPRSSVHRAILAYFCAQMGQTERASLEAAQAVQLSPNNDTLWLAALAYERTGNRDAALKTLEGAPRSLLDDMQRWPEASSLTSDSRFGIAPQAVRPR
jgi:tetratricopeptide (TPR) repeat protein